MRSLLTYSLLDNVPCRGLYKLLVGFSDCIEECPILQEIDGVGYGSLKEEICDPGVHVSPQETT